MIPKTVMIRLRTLKRPKNRKIEFFHFPLFRITRIIRNKCYQKRTALSLCVFFASRSQGRFFLSSDFSFPNRFSALPPEIDGKLDSKKFPLTQRCFSSTPILPEALFQNSCKSLRNIRVRLPCSRARCRSVPHLLHLLQSTVLPEPPDNQCPPKR